MTVIPERRSDTDIIALFLAGISLAVAWRADAPVVSIVSVAIATVILGGWIYLRMTPNFALTIGPDEIVYGRPNEPRAAIGRGATAGVLIKYEGENGWFLVGADRDDPAARPPLSLIGFDPCTIAKACAAHGWPVTMNPPLDCWPKSRRAARS